MNAKWKMLLLVLTLSLLVGGCAAKTPQTEYAILTQAPQFQPTEAPVSDVSSDLRGGDVLTDFDSGDYNPEAEEGLGDDAIINLPSDSQMTAADLPTTAPTVQSAFAGATPIVIDPIDKPTPTPAPALTFSYTAYSADKLKLSFEGPTDWMVDDTSSDTYVLTNPDTNMSYPATITLRATGVNSGYSSSNLTKEVQQMLATLKESGFKKFSASRTASRTLLDHKGVYANFTATLDDGTKIGGRVHATTMNRMLYTLTMTYPADYINTYEHQVYRQLRKTLKLVK